MATTAGSDWAGQTLADLRRRGGRTGGARTAVVELLGRQTCCVTAQELHDELRAAGRRVALASVYRTLDRLSSDGFVQKIELGAGVTRYEPVRRDGDHHHHLVCDACGKVEAFADDRLEQAIHRVEHETGYRVAAHDVVLRGACSDCTE